MREIVMLPVHGFVLAGGKSLRMGQDKALLRVRGKPMVAIAVEKLQQFCSQVSIAGNRDDLSLFAPVLREARLDAGPGAGIEAGLKASSHAWAMFIPVDVPLVPAGLLRAWVEDVMAGSSQKRSTGSYLRAEGRPQPTFCTLMRESQSAWTEMLDQGEHRLELILDRIQAPGRNVVESVEAAQYEPRATPLLIKSWFRNVNTPEELSEAESVAKFD